MHGLISYRRFKGGRSLRSDRAERMLGRYIVTERDGRSVATLRPSLARARSLRSDQAGRSDRAWLELGRYVATGQRACAVVA
ncbi:hypothetical protein DY000_02049156 [Brassica cretica]|uniref:Uncharacterized protein n=1 Tax=Brassica cretica TaxID=69181 RepID=A0ABQ7EX28_BRACR|nr:hypothetical protein DY000_02049156 [Brassica cretica]